MDAVCDLELEQALLAHLLARPSLIDEVDPILTPEDFAEPSHGAVFAAMRAFEGPFTPIALKRSLMEIEIGGLSPVEYLDQIEHYVIESHRDAAVPKIAEQLIDFSRRRAIIQLCSSVSLAASRADSPSYNQLLEDVEDQLYRVPTTGEAFAVKSAADGGDEALAQAKQIMATGGAFGVRAKLRAWNNLIGQMLAGDLIVVGGTTSAGKTALVQQIGYEVAESEVVVVYSLEMTSPQWTTRYLSQQTGIETERIETGQLSDEEFAKLTEANDERVRPLNMVVTDRPCLSVGQMRSFAKRVRRRQGKLGLIIIDHLQFIQPPARMEGPAAVAAITRDLKAMAKDLEVPIILVSHLNRDISHRDNKRPMLSDLFGSSAIEKDADAVLFVHREHYWIARQGAKLPEDPNDWMQAEELRRKWQAAMKHVERDAELILAKRRRGRGDGTILLDFDMRGTKFRDRSTGRLF